MKVRFHGSSIRLRLTQGEVELVAAGKPVQSSTPIAADQVFCVLLAPDVDAKAARTTFAPTALEIHAPAGQLTAWAKSNDEGIYYEQPVPGHPPLKIAFEKDYACLHKPDENLDTFPNPTRLAPS